jgi:hypothetical protein
MKKPREKVGKFRVQKGHGIQLHLATKTISFFVADENRRLRLNWPLQFRDQDVNMKLLISTHSQLAYYMLVEQLKFPPKGRMLDIKTMRCDNKIIECYYD